MDWATVKKWAHVAVDFVLAVCIGLVIGQGFILMNTADKYLQARTERLSATGTVYTDQETGVQYIRFGDSVWPRVSRDGTYLRSSTKPEPAVFKYNM